MIEINIQPCPNNEQNTTEDRIGILRFGEGKVGSFDWLRISEEPWRAVLWLIHGR
jgi:hypothetical protein